MGKIKNVFSVILNNIVRVLKLAYAIDGRLLIYYYLTATIGAISPIIAAYIFKFTIDKIVQTNSLNPTSSGVPLFIIFALAGYFAMHLVEHITYWGLNVNYFDYLIRNKLQSGLTYRYSKKMSQLDLGYLEDPEIQNLITKVEQTYTWQIPDFIRIWNYIFRDLVGILAIIIAFSEYGIWIPAVLILVAIPRAYFKLRYGNFVWSMFGGNAPQAKKLWYISDLLTSKSSIIETRIFQSQKTLLLKLSEILDHLYNVNKKPLDNYRAVLVLAPVAEGLVIFAVIYSFIPQVLSGVISIGTLTFIITTLQQLRDHMTWSTTHFGELYEKSLFVSPYFELMNLPKLIKEVPTPKRFGRVNPPKIEFKNVSFTYPNGRRVLENISFVIHPGESVALVGINGAGKSTLIKLLCRFYDVTEGEILINGVNIKNLKLSNWYRFLGTLFQDFVKYNFTVRENIQLGNPGVLNEEEMKSAAIKSGAYGFIKTFDKGYDQMLGRHFENGEELSSGQWQKIALARAFYEKAPVLILDEPTSAIDAESEYKIFQSIEKVYKNKTLILVSHRFSTVRNANKIMVIDGGRIVESGTHQELLAQKGEYAQMFETQAKGYK